MEKDIGKAQKNLIKFLCGLKEKATAAFPNNRYDKYRNYYNGDFETLRNKNRKNQNNIIKRIVDTKTTLVLDNDIVTNVVPAVLSLRDMESIKSARDISDILNDAKNNVLKTNNYKTINQEVLENAKIENIGIAMLYWDQSLDRNLGNVRIKSIAPKNFMPESTAKELDDCNYIFIRSMESAYTLKKKYPQFSQQIDRLVGKKTPDNLSMGQIKGMTTVTNTQNTQQMYVYDTKGLESLSDQVETFIAFLKDDSVYMTDETQEDPETKEVTKTSKLKYPNGRFVMFAKDIVFEDKAIDYRFGYPISTIKTDCWETLLSDGGEVKDLIQIQDRLNLTYNQRAKMVGDFVSYIVVDPDCGLDRNDFVNQTVIVVDPGSLARGSDPKVLTNNTLAELAVLNEYIKDLKIDALEVARINETILSGQRQQGVNSGDMVEALNESPMIGIRQDQRNFENYFVDLNRKIIEMIQKHYNVERIIKTSSGYAQIPLRASDQEGEAEIQLFDENIKSVKRIKGDLTLMNFNIDIIAGSEIPRSRTQFANLTMQLWREGILSPVGNVEEKERLLDALDYPDRRAIIKEIREQQAKMSEKPSKPEIKEMGINFKDLEMFPEAQTSVLIDLGLVE